MTKTAMTTQQRDTILSMTEEGKTRDEIALALPDLSLRQIKIVQTANAHGRRLGRPKVLTEAVLQRINDEVASGVSIETACRENNVAFSTYRQRINRGKPRGPKKLVTEEVAVRARDLMRYGHTVEEAAVGVGVATSTLRTAVKRSAEQRKEDAAARRAKIVAILRDNNRAEGVKGVFPLATDKEIASAAEEAAKDLMA